MRVIIIEDEAPAATHLTRLLKKGHEDIEIVKRLDSIEASVKYLPSCTGVDLIFMDIQLADGLCFSIFEQTPLSIPVIFTTAFDQYTLKAFKVNSLDYLLKPIDEGELHRAVSKYRQLYPPVDKNISGRIDQLVREMSPARYRERLLIKRGQQLHYLKTADTAHYYADGKLCYATDFNGLRYLVEFNLNQLEQQLDPAQFYRVSRHLLVNIGFVKKVHHWLGGRLKLELAPPTRTEADSLVSRERVSGFKDWLGQ